ncbi:MAG TPA: YceI family protein [Terriglobales bacterium]|nr:YceI family protein [Terriglobales bacterium]
MRVLVGLLCATFVPLAGAADASRLIDVEKLVMTVHVYKAGLFSAFGHNHEITAPIERGSFSDEKPVVDLVVNAHQMKVMDQDVSDKDRAEIQQTMLGPKVLDTEKFPNISFRSTQVEKLGSSKFVVDGDLTLHGQTRPMRVEVEGQGGRYRGVAVLKQTAFGITPVTVGGGAVKVKNEVRVEFEIVAK